jgi:hypothetical protein
MPTKKEAARLTAQENTLCTLGFTPDESERLRRISLTLRRWHELECGIDGGCIERDDATGRPYWRADSGRRWPVADREAGALRRLQKIMRDVNERRFVGDTASTLDAHCDDLNTYIQPDPRGAALYILRPGDVPAGERADSYYTRGLCVH